MWSFFGRCDCVKLCGGASGKSKVTGLDRGTVRDAEGAFKIAEYDISVDAEFKKMGIGKRELIQLTKSMMALDFKEDLNKVDCRTLIVCGEKDRANRGASEMMAEKIHGARIKILEGCGHEVNVEVLRRKVGWEPDRNCGV